MAKDLYPNVKFQEIDLSTFVRSNSSSIGGTVGRFEKGPVGRPILVNDKNDLINNFGIPQSGTFNNLQDWYTVSNFLNYTSGIYVVRSELAASLNSGKNFNATAANLSSNIHVGDGFDMSSVTGLSQAGLNIISKNPGTWGNYVKVGLALYADVTETDGYYYDYSVQITLTAELTGLATGDYVVTASGATGLVTALSTTAVTIHYNGTDFVLGEIIHEGQTYNSGAAIQTTIAEADTTPVATLGYNTFMANFSETLSAGEIAISVYASDNYGTTYTIRENFIVSTTVGTKTFDGKAMYIDDYLEQNSNYISSVYVSTASALVSYTTAVLLTGGTLDTGSASTLRSAAIVQWDENFKDKNALAVNILIDGAFAGDDTVMDNIIAIAEFRKDCFAVLSCGTGITVANEANALAALQVMRAGLTTSTYAAFYGNYKIQYDAYSGRNFNCSISGDVAGIYARNDILAQPWYAPSGYNRGGIQNVVKLPVTFSKTNQGIMHSAQINIITEDKKIGGFYIISQKTVYGRPSAFGDVNVRRLLTYCENSILNAMISYQWEFNDILTRSSVSSITSNFMNIVKSRNGVYNYLVVCDETNNTSDIIDNNELYVDIFLKPTKAINWLTLRFTATRTDANFEEMVA